MLKKNNKGSVPGKIIAVAILVLVIIIVGFSYRGLPDFFEKNSGTLNESSLKSICESAPSGSNLDKCKLYNEQKKAEYEINNYQSVCVDDNCEVMNVCDTKYEFDNCGSFSQKAEAEYERWNYGKIKEDETDAYNLIRPIYNSVNRCPNKDDFLIDEFHNKNPWSAAFVTYVTCGRLEGYAHSSYINKVYNNKSNSFSFIDISTIENIDDIKVDDIICGTRNGDKFNSNSGYKAHCDVVVNVDKNYFEVIGGNLKNTVLKVKYDLKDAKSGKSKLIFFKDKNTKYNIGILRYDFSNDNYDSSKNSDYINEIVKLNFDLENKGLESLNKVKSDTRIKKTFENLKNLKIDIKGKRVSALDYLNAASKVKGIDPAFAFLVITQESLGNTKAISYTGCKGLFQFCSGTAQEYESYFGNYDYKTCNNFNKCSDDPRFDPRKSIDSGVAYLYRLSKTYNNNMVLILSAYNAGAGATSSKCKDEISKEDLVQCTLDKTYDHYGGDGKVDEVKTYLKNIITDYNSLS